MLCCLALVGFLQHVVVSIFLRRGAGAPLRAAKATTGQLKGQACIPGGLNSIPFGCLLPSYEWRSSSLELTHNNEG